MKTLLCTVKDIALKRIHPALNSLAFLPVLGMRLWVASVFWKSGMTKLSSWESTVALFADEYQVPILPPELAAYMGTAVELTAPILLVVGLGTRFAALSLLIMTAVIEFTYMHFDEHVIWALMLSLIFLQGAGKASIDYFIHKKITAA
jgi:putative oxidoreductase